MRNPFARRRHARPFQPVPEQEVDAELSFHLDQRIRDYVEQGMDPEAARAAALERFGDLGNVRRECEQMLEEHHRASARRDWFDDLRQDLKFGVRGALRSPLFSLLAIVTLALGIGANAAVFGVVKSVLLNSLPYRDAGRLVQVYGRSLDGTHERGPLSAGTATDIMQRQRSFTSMATFASGPHEAVLSGTDQPHVVNIEWAEPGLFQTLGVAPALGRPLRTEDAQSDTAFTVLLTHAAWQRYFAGDSAIVGRTVIVNAIPRTVAGVLPRGFVGPAGETDFYFPLSVGALMRDPIRSRGSQWLNMIGRLEPGVSAAAAQRELVGIAADIAREHPRESGSFSVSAMPLRDAMVGDTRTPLLVLMASAGLVLLIACANLAGALLSRTLSRRKEFAIRVALGASRGRLIRQLLAESTVLALAGGAAGIVLAIVALGALRGLASGSLPSYAELTLDRGALLFTSLLALATGIAFGLAPALSVSHADTQSTLRDESRGSSEGGRSRRLRGMLVAGQIALCVSLLAAAGLLARSLWAMTSAPLGFADGHVLLDPVQLPRTYATPESQSQFFDQLEQRLRALPGVVSVADATEAPASVLSRNGIAIIGAPPPTDAQPFVLYSSVSDDYFHTLGIPLRSGRLFDARDADGPPTLVISEAMARRYWPRGGALGAQLRLGPDPNSTPFTVVGIVGDVRNDPASPDAEPMTYSSARQSIEPSRQLLIRTRGDPLSLTGALRREMAALDPAVPYRDAVALSDFVSDKLTARRLPVVLMSAFGVLALLLASVGVYAMFAAMATAREREFGVRMALGSSRRAIAGLVLRQGALWMAVGLAVGAVGVVVIVRFVRGLLYGVSQHDPLTFAAVVVLLLVFATIALLVPVRRATRVNPISVLR